MSKIKKEMSERGELSEVVAEKPAQTLGRKRDHTRDDKILEAAIAILADTSFDGMTMDMVAKTEQRLGRRRFTAAGLPRRS